jgi:cob(I)alamin adenosyltransferase
LFAGAERVSKANPRTSAYGEADEAVAALGLARAEALAAGEDDVAEMVLELQRELFVLNAELATPPEHADRLQDGLTRVTAPMVEALERRIDDLTGRFEQPKDFIVPGNTKAGAALDLAARVVRRAERAVVALADVRPEALGYLNRLSDLVWVLARYAERTERQPRPREG